MKKPRNISLTDTEVRRIKQASGIDGLTQSIRLLLVLVEQMLDKKEGK